MTNTQIMISKYCASTEARAERLRRSNEKEFLVSGAKFNYGPTKGKENRVAVLKRRQKAWSEGLRKGYGIHYKTMTADGWLWDKKECTDIRDYPEVYKYLLKIQNQMRD